MDRIWFALGCLAGLAAVATAALAAHALPADAPANAQGMAESAARMLGWHGLALLACGVWAARGGVLAHLAAAAFVIGVVLFASAVLIRAFTGVSLGPTAPIGGTTLMLGWLLLGCSALRAR